MHETQLPSLEAAIAAIGQEETSLKSNEKEEFTQRPAYLVFERQETGDYYNCGVNGHLTINVQLHLVVAKEVSEVVEGTTGDSVYYRGGRGRNG
jgi:hypothetical protein